VQKIGCSIGKENDMKKIIMIILVLSLSICNSYGWWEKHTVYVTKSGNIAAPYYSDFKKAKDMWLSDDHVALQSMINAKRVIWMGAGHFVYVIEQDYPYIKIRVKGTTLELWTYDHAIEEQKK